MIILKYLFCLLIGSENTLYSEEEEQVFLDNLADKASECQIDDISLALGYYFAKGMFVHKTFFPFNVDKIVSGIEKAISDNYNQFEYTIEQLSEDLQKLSDSTLDQVSIRNMQISNDFMKENIKRDEVNFVGSENEIQYEVLNQSHSNDEEVDSLNDFINISGLLVDYKIIDLYGLVSEESSAEGVLCEKNNIIFPKVQNALLGMTIGEERRLYMHPNATLDPKTASAFGLAPNMVIILDIKLREIQYTIEEESLNNEEGMRMQDLSDEEFEL